MTQKNHRKARRAKIDASPLQICNTRLIVTQREIVALHESVRDEKTSVILDVRTHAQIFDI